MKKLYFQIDKKKKWLQSALRIVITHMSLLKTKNIYQDLYEFGDGEGFVGYQIELVFLI